MRLYQALCLIAAVFASSTVVVVRGRGRAPTSAAQVDHHRIKNANSASGGAAVGGDAASRGTDIHAEQKPKSPKRRAFFSSSPRKPSSSNPEQVKDLSLATSTSSSSAATDVFLSLHPLFELRGGGWFGAWFIPAGYNPLGYKITPLGEEFLKFPGSLDSDVGRFLAGIRDRKTASAIKSTWREIVRAAKSKQAMSIYKSLEDLTEFCLKAGLID